MAAHTFQFHWRWALRSTPAQLWPHVADTGRFDEATGFPAPQFTEIPQAAGGSHRLARLRKYGALIAWHDAPWEWVREREYTAVRECITGPLGATKNTCRLEPRADGGTDVIYEVAARPGNVLGYPGIPVQIGLLMRRQFERAFRRIDAYIQAQTPQPFATHHTPVSTAGQARLREFASQLTTAGHAPALISRLLDLVRSAPDDQLTRMRPYALADAWGSDRHAMLALFLHASRLGLLDLSWDLICPDCRGAKRQVPSLREVSAHAHCPSCNVNYAVDFARSVEATFQVNAGIKRVMRAEYCVGGPQNTPHILAQQVLAPGETRTLALPLPAHRYRWRPPGLAGAPSTPRAVNDPEDPARGRILLTVDPTAPATTCAVRLDSAGLTLTPEAVGSGTITFTLHNATEQPQVALIEETDWSDQAASAATVTSMQAFRDLFSSESLRPGEAISVESLTILFTDLKGSTLLYRTIGDAPAFGQVMTHFDILREGVAAHHGGLVKTIGDSIMAVFPDPGDGLAAVLDILQRFRAYNMEHAGPPMVLKMGLHCGACIAVTLNDRLDYFGSVVNIAARLEGQSTGDAVVISEAVATDPAVATLLAATPVQIEPFTAYLRGFAEPFALRRVGLTDAILPLALREALVEV